LQTVKGGKVNFGVTKYLFLLLTTNCPVLQGGPKGDHIKKFITYGYMMTYRKAVIMLNTFQNVQ